MRARQLAVHGTIVQHVQVPGTGFPKSTEQFIFDFQNDCTCLLKLMELFHNWLVFTFTYVYVVMAVTKFLLTLKHVKRFLPFELQLDIITNKWLV